MKKALSLVVPSVKRHKKMELEIRRKKYGKCLGK
jgi:hypothetical protein